MLHRKQEAVVFLFNSNNIHRIRLSRTEIDRGLFSHSENFVLVLLSSLLSSTSILFLNKTLGCTFVESISFFVKELMIFVAKQRNIGWNFPKSNLLADVEFSWKFVSSFQFFFSWNSSFGIFNHQASYKSFCAYTWVYRVWVKSDWIANLRSHVKHIENKR